MPSVLDPVDKGKKPVPDFKPRKRVELYDDVMRPELPESFPAIVSQEQRDYIRRVLDICCSDSRFAEKAYDAISYILNPPPEEPEVAPKFGEKSQVEKPGEKPSVEPTPPARPDQGLPGNKPEFPTHERPVKPEPQPEPRKNH